MYRKVIVSDKVTQVAPYNPRRVSITIINIGGTTAYVSNDPTNILDNGFPLFPNCIMTLSREDGDMPELVLYGQTVSGQAELRVQEGLI